MKKLLTFLLLLSYTLSSIGATISTHYCNGKVMKCKCAKTKKSNKIDRCCKNTKTFIKSKLELTTLTSTEIKKQILIDSTLFKAFINVNYYSLIIIKSQTKYDFNSSSSPPIYKFICSYRV
jgi:hypothetical protein